MTERVHQVAALLAMLVAIAHPHRAAAQVGEEIPGPNYYLGVQALYFGEYRDAAQELRRQSQRGLRTTLARWVDSVCYHAMLGEVFYHQGRNAEALTEFDQACQYILQYPDWLGRVNWQRPPQPDLAARRAVPWGQSTRQSTPAQFPRTEQVAFGRLDNSAAVNQGGVIQAPELRRVNVVEIIRTSALAIRRRAELLGPLAPHDQIFKDLSNALSRGNLTPAGHWSSAWIDLLRGLVEGALGRVDQAGISLNRATIIGGQFDHPLTGVALLEQGRLAIRSGNGGAAAQLLSEATFSAYFYEDWDVLSESVLLGWANHVAHGGSGIYPATETVGAWAQVNRLQHTTVKLRLAQAESLLWAGQVQPAVQMLTGPARALGQMSGSLASIHQLYLQAVVHFLQGRTELGNTAIHQALAAQATASLRNFQISLSDKAYDSGAITSRIAVDLYKSLLGEPTPSDWAYQPLDVMAVLITPSNASFDRWFLAAVDRKDVAAAIDVTELAKRRRFLASLPLGGRLQALRTILEAPERELSRDAILQRQQYLASVPQYRELSSAGAAIENELRASSILPKPGEDARKLNDLYEKSVANAVAREQLIQQLALRRVPSSLEFPPWRPVTEWQPTLAEGEALVVFHAAAGQLYGFLLTSTDVRPWTLGEIRRLRPKIVEFLRDLGNAGAARTLSIDDLARKAWHKSASETFAAIFGEARFDLAKTKRLVIVPDDLLWYVPFESLLPDTLEPLRPIGVRIPLRYGPTASLVVGNAQPLRRPQRTAIIGAEMNADEEITGGDDLLAELEMLVAGPLRLSPPLPQPGYALAPLIDSLVVFDDVLSDRGNDADWSPLPRSSAGAADTLNAWMSLPFGGPERVIVTSFTTDAEQGLRTARRAANAPLPGSDVFQAVCRLMANGAKTIMLTRWRTGGRTNFDLAREFIQELPHESAAVAWQRAVVLARETPIDLHREPRLKRAEVALPTPPTAEHPFFWAGYLLVDTGTQPGAEDAPRTLPDSTPAGNLIQGSPAAPADAPAGEPTAPLPVPQGARNNAAKNAKDPDVAKSPAAATDTKGRPATSRSTKAPPRPANEESK